MSVDVCAISDESLVKNCCLVMLCSFVNIKRGML